MTAPLVLITGASSGIGMALAEAYLARGARLALLARRTDPMLAWRSSKGLTEENVGIYGADVQDVEATTEAGRACMNRQGLPDVVIANAGVSVGMDTAEFEDLEVMRRCLATNVLGMAATFQPFVAPMRARRSEPWWASRASRAFAACPGTGRTAPARRRRSPTSRACEASAEALASGW